jgi:phage terminase large subunit
MFPSEGDDQFIPANIVDEAMNRPKYKDITAPIIIGVDPARFGADATVIAIRQGRDIVRIDRHRGDDTMTVVGHIIEAIEEFKPALVVIDEGGLGAGIVDRLNEQRYKIKGINFGNKSKNPIMYGNMRAQMWGTMKEWLRTASIPKDRFLKTDLVSPMIKPDSRGTIFLESKKDMKARGLASPDAADAICVTFAFPVAHRESKAPPRVLKSYDKGGASTGWMSA